MKKLRSELERLQSKKKKIQADLNKTKAKLREREKKARNRKLIELGSLVEIALPEVTEVDKGALLGAMIEIAHLLQDWDTFNQLKAKGDEILQQRPNSPKQLPKRSSNE